MIILTRKCVTNDVQKYPN